MRLRKCGLYEADVRPAKVGTVGRNESYPSGRFARCSRLNQACPHVRVVIQEAVEPDELRPLRRTKEPCEMTGLTSVHQRRSTLSLSTGMTRHVACDRSVDVENIEENLRAWLFLL